MDWIKVHLLSLAIAALPVSLFSALLYQGVKRLLEAQTNLLNHTPDWLHRVYFGITVVLVTAAASALGIPIVCPAAASCLDALNDPKILDLVVKALLGIAAGFIAHAGKVAVVGNAPEPVGP